MLGWGSGEKGWLQGGEPFSYGMSCSFHPLLWVEACCLMGPGRLPVAFWNLH